MHSKSIHDINRQYTISIYGSCLPRRSLELFGVWRANYTRQFAAAVVLIVNIASDILQILHVSSGEGRERKREGSGKFALRVSITTSPLTDSDSVVMETCIDPETQSQL